MFFEQKLKKLVYYYWMINKNYILNTFEENVFKKS